MTLYLKAHPQDDGLIDVRIDRVPRWKESYLSGDEWRFNLRGVVRYKDWVNGGLAVQAFSGYSLHDISIQIAAWINEHQNQTLTPPYSVRDASEIRVCFQPGCTEQPENVYAIRQEWTWHPHQGHRMEKRGHPVVRAFCGQHCHRGDCALEDADDNYELYAGPPGPR